MRSAEDEKLLDKVRRLLRLAESSNVHEASVAAERAQELIARHRLELSALDDSAADEGIEDLRDAPLDASTRLRPWKTVLAGHVAKANGCRVYIFLDGSTRRLVLVGRPDDAELVRGLYAALVTRVECLTRHHGAGRDRRYCNAFRLGAVATLGERLAGAVAAVAEEPGTTGAALARLEARDEAVDRFMARTLKLRAGRRSRLRADAEGYERGRVAGHGIALDEDPMLKS